MGGGSGSFGGEDTVGAEQRGASGTLVSSTTVTELSTDMIVFVSLRYPIRDKTIVCAVSGSASVAL